MPGYGFSSSSRMTLTGSVLLGDRALSANDMKEAFELNFINPTVLKQILNF